MADKRPPGFKNQNFNALKRDCLQEQTLFSDDLFKRNIAGVEWLRPHEICEDPHFFVEGVSRFDIEQGQLGDCWLITAMINLTLNPRIFDHVVPPDQSFGREYAGIFHFRIWQCGDWVDVVVDDRLPTVDGELQFSHSKENNEFWSPLLEKAYAKVYGGYDQLKGGWFCESMVDFTGGMVETVCFNPPPPDLDNILFTSFIKSSFMCIYMKNDPNQIEEITAKGLVKGHAYCVSKIIKIPVRQQQIMLLRLMNPWGRQEWNGAWSDSSPEWNSVSQGEKEELGLVNEDNGDFWMCLDDITTHFQYIDICHLNPSLYDAEGEVKDLLGGRVRRSAPESLDALKGKQSWKVHMFKGEWIRDVNAGGNSQETIHFNPQFRITLTDTDGVDDNICTVIIALMQKNLRRNIWHRIGFTIFRLDDNTKPGILSKDYIQGKLSQSITTPFKHTRELVCRHKLSPGEYCIIPSTHNPNMEGKFLLRVFTEKESVMENTEEHTYKDNTWPATTQTISEMQTPNAKQTLSTKPPPGKSVDKLVYRSDQEVKAFFDRVSDRHKEVGWEKLQSVLQFALSPDRGIFTSSTDSKDVKFPKYECRTLIAMLDDNRSGKLDFDEFDTLWSQMRQWESVFLKCSGNTEHITAPLLKQALTMAGYRVTSAALGAMVRQHADDAGRFTFNDFVMCAVELQTR